MFAIVQKYSPDTFSTLASQAREPCHVVRRGRCRRFHFDGEQLSLFVFDDQVYFHAVFVSVVRKTVLPLRPRRLRAEFSDHERLQQWAEQCAVFRDSRVGHASNRRRHAAVDSIQFWSLHQSLEIGVRPRR